ncbi:MAG: 4'-phosphopantetheinyl transferase superfamily protein [Rubrivivax sp.]|nr:4'-phosphopantetheinyl transferase superfamily protein [Rubrivivax sp.]
MATDGSVHVWVGDSPPVAPAALALLAPEEKARAARLGEGPPGRAFVAARVLLRQALSWCRGVAAQDWRFEADAHGRPWIVQPADAAALHFSLSHTAGCVVCAVSTQRVIGVDVEPADRAIELRSVRRVLTPLEQAWVTAEPGCTRERLLRLWTLKEAYGKSVGLGLQAALSSVGFVQDAPGGEGLQLHAPSGTVCGSARQWRIHARFILALVMGAPAGQTHWHGVDPLALEPLQDGPPRPGEAESRGQVQGTACSSSGHRRRLALDASGVSVRKPHGPQVFSCE